MLQIATGISRNASIWKNENITVDQLIDTFKKPVETKYTIDEWEKLVTAQKESIVDIGGIIGGYCAKGSRKNVETISLLYFETNNIEKVLNNAYKTIIYSLCGQQDKYGVIIPFEKPLKISTYEQIAIYLSDELGFNLDQLYIKTKDKKQIKTNKMIYYPTCLKDTKINYNIQIVGNECFGSKHIKLIQKELKENYYLSKETISNIKLENGQKLKSFSNWVVWGDIDRKHIKTPINALTNSNAYPDNKNTWNSFDLACSTVEQNNYFGIGLMLPGTNIIGIDIDHCIDADGRISDIASEIITKVNSYTEISPSKEGIRILVHDKDNRFDTLRKTLELTHYMNKNSELGLEFYSEKDNRYLTITGNLLDNMYIDVKSNIEPVKSLYEKYLKKNNNAAKNKTNSNNVVNGKKVLTNIEFTDEEILNKLRSSKKCFEFEEAYNIPGAPGNSEKDIKVIGMLAYYTQNIKQICRIMLNSPLCREKFIKNKKYLETSAINAINNLDSYYDPGYSKANNSNKIKTNKLSIEEMQEQKNLIMNDVFKKLTSQKAEIGSMQEINWVYVDDNLKIVINTGLLSEYLRSKLHYIFIRSDAQGGIQRYIYNNGVYSLSNDEEFKFHIKKYIPLENRKSNQLKEVLCELYTDNNFYTFLQLNPEKYINFKDCLFNIETWETENHTPKVLTTIQLPLEYPKDTYINNRVFDNYINYLVDNNQDLRKLLIQFMGIAVSNVYGHRMKKALFMVGAHNTGKSKIKELLIKLIGEQNANTLDLETLEARFGSSQILNKRLIGSNDMSYMKVKELKIFKLITGGDTIFMENKGQNGFNSKFQGLAWFCCNELPKFSGDKGEGVYDRFTIVECNKKSIPEEKQNKKLLEDMFDEKEYILTLALTGLKEVIENNYRYDIPECCIEHLKNYKIENDSFLKFFDECCEELTEDEILKETKSNIYKYYVNWCKDNNNGYYQTKQEVTKLLIKKDLNDEVKRNGGNRYYSKFKLTKEFLDEYEPDFV